MSRRRRFSFDVTGAYLQGEYEENEVVYARPLKGYRSVHDDVSPIVWLMRVPLYGSTALFGVGPKWLQIR